MVWGKIGSTTLTANAEDIDITTTHNIFSTVLASHIKNTGNIAPALTFNDDTSSVYVRRYSTDGGSDTTATEPNLFTDTVGTGTQWFNVTFIANTASKEKLVINNMCYDHAGGVKRQQMVGKWVNTSSAITKISWDRANSAGTFASGTNVTALGSDITPAPTVPAIPSLLPSLQSPSIGGWKEIDRTTLDASTTGDVTVSGLGTAGRKRTFMILMDQQSSGITRPNLRINGDTGSNYLYSYSYNGGGNGGNNSSYNQAELSNAEANGVNQFNVVFLTNNSDGDMKQGLSWNIFPNGGGNNSANCTKTAFKWTNTSDAVTSVSLYNDKAGDWDSGSEVVVLEYDENDIHTDNFWEELASEEVGVGQTSTSIDTGTFASKKYLMFQIFTRKSANGDTRLQFNGDTGVRYTQKNVITNDSGVNTYDYDTDNGLTMMNISGDQTASGSTEDFFVTGFIYNNSANASKLVRGEGVFSAGANSSNIGNMIEFANKYVPATSTDTITSVQVVNSTFLEGSIIKVWGSN